MVKLSILFSANIRLVRQATASLDVSNCVYGRGKLLEINGTPSTQLYNQSARITITSFTPGAAAAVPEPTTMIMLGSGLAGLIIAKRRRRRALP